MRNEKERRKRRSGKGNGLSKNQEMKRGRERGSVLATLPL